MNTTNPNEDLYADFFQVRKNNTSDESNFLTGSMASLMAGKKGKGGKQITLKKLSAMGKLKVLGFGKMYQKYTTLYMMLKEEHKMSEYQIEKYWREFKEAGNTDVAHFMDWLQSEKADEVKTLNDAVVSDLTLEQDLNTPVETDVVDVSDVDYTKKPKSTYLYIGLGVVALVGVTILITRRK